MIVDRILRIIELKGLNKSRFYKETGLSNGFLDKVKDVGASKIELILKTYPDINPKWILTGKGDIFKNNTNNTEHDINYNSILSNAEPISDNTVEVLTNTHGNKFYIQEDDRIVIEVLKIPFPAYASYLEVSEDETRLLEDEFSNISFPVDHIGRGSYIAFEVKGDSMNGGGIDDTPDGADILCREIGRHLWTSGFRKTRYGSVLLTKTGIYHKDIVNYNENNGQITLESRNKECEPFQLNLNDVYKIYNVIKRSF